MRPDVAGYLELDKVSDCLLSGDGRDFMAAHDSEGCRQRPDARLPCIGEEMIYNFFKVTAEMKSYDGQLAEDCVLARQ